MGAGGSASNKKKVQETIAQEFAKPADATDVDTPRGVSAKAEVVRLRALLAEQSSLQQLLCKAILGDAPSLEGYLQTVFAKHDVDADGTLSPEEFTKLLGSLELGLSSDDLQKLIELSDADQSGSISVKEFCVAAPEFLKTIYTSTETTHEPEWARLYDAEHDSVYFYNKRTGESTWTPPNETVNEIAVSMENEMASDVREYLKRVFKEADVNDSGTLSNEELWGLVQNRLQLGLSEEEYLKLLDMMDVDKDGDIAWQEFVLSAPDYIKTIKEGTNADECWIMATDEEGNQYYYNTLTGESSWARPAGFTGAANADGEAAPADVSDEAAPAEAPAAEEPKAEDA